MLHSLLFNIAFVALICHSNALLFLDIFLNFAAVEFISNLDYLAFELAVTGYAGRTIRRNAEDIQDIKFPISHPKLKWVGQFCFYLLLASLFLAGQLSGQDRATDICSTIPHVVPFQSSLVIRCLSCHRVYPSR